MISELYDALKEAGASEASARKAAETMAGYGSGFARIDVALATMATKADIANMATKADIANMATKADIANMATKGDVAEAKFDVLRWLFGAIGFQTIIILGAVVALARLAH
jgi:hypothetical protein